MDLDAYARQLRQLLPAGALWPEELDSWLTKTLQAMAGELARVDDRAQTLTSEWDPRTALETLEDWERMLGLPDTCLTSIPSSISARRAAILQKLAARGGQTKQFYIDLASNLGYTITVDEFSICRVGARIGDRCQDLPWAHAWQVNAPLATAPGLFRAGSALAGDRLGVFGDPALECVIQRSAPAQTAVLFAYT